MIPILRLPKRYSCRVDPTTRVGLAERLGWLEDSSDCLTVYVVLNEGRPAKIPRYHQAVSNGIGGKHIDFWIVGDCRFLVLDENGSEQVEVISPAGLLEELLEEGIIDFA